MIGLYSIFAGFVAALVFALLLDPSWKATKAQDAIVNQFVARYCHPNDHVSREFLLGEAAALSRVTIESGLEPIAWAEYLKCKAGL